MYPAPTTATRVGPPWARGVRRDGADRVPRAGPAASGEPAGRPVGDDGEAATRGAPGVAAEDAMVRRIGRCEVSADPLLRTTAAARGDRCRAAFPGAARPPTGRSRPGFGIRRSTPHVRGDDGRKEGHLLLLGARSNASAFGRAPLVRRSTLVRVTGHGGGRRGGRRVAARRAAEVATDGRDSAGSRTGPPLPSSPSPAPRGRDPTPAGAGSPAGRPGPEGASSAPSAGRRSGPWPPRVGAGPRHDRPHPQQGASRWCRRRWTPSPNGAGDRARAQGGIGIVHKNLPIERQVAEVDKVKRSANGVIQDPVTLAPDATIGEARKDLMQSTRSAACRCRPATRWSGS
jgi:hypothetical protein